MSIFHIRRPVLCFSFPNTTSTLLHREVRWVSNRSKSRLPKTVSSKPTRQQVLTLPSSYQYQPSSPPHASQSPSTPNTLTRKRPLRPYIFVASFFIFILSAYGSSLYTGLLRESAAPHDPDAQDASLTTRYDDTAPTYDALVDGTEYWTGITRLRRKLLGLARGSVLESCVGTGRNAAFYKLAVRKGGEHDDDDDDEKRVVRSVVAVDRSPAMIAIAAQKWEKIHLGSKAVVMGVESGAAADDDTKTAADGNVRSLPKCTFLPQASDMDLPAPLQPPGGFTTIVQTMGLCSLPNPVATLRHLASLAHPADGKILLLEHGRSDYAWINWILDRSARRHAEVHGCWYNRDVGEILAELERDGVLVLERVERPWWQLGTVWMVVARPGSRARDAISGEKDEGRGALKSAEQNGSRDWWKERGLRVSW